VTRFCSPPRVDGNGSGRYNRFVASPGLGRVEPTDRGEAATMGHPAIRTITEVSWVEAVRLTLHRENWEVRRSQIGLSHELERIRGTRILGIAV